MPVELEAGIVRVVGPRGSTTGTGFVVSGDGLVITCAHVVTATVPQRSPISQTVTLVPVTNGESRQAHVALDHWRPPDAGDVAILRIEGGLPEGVEPLLLGPARGTAGHPFSTFGYPRARTATGIRGIGEIVGLVPNGAGGDLVQLRSSEVTRGFSGAPVWDTRTQRVVGMVAAITSRDPDDRLGETVFATPTEALRQVCPALNVSEIPPYRGLEAFTRNDADFFHGRDRLVNDLLARLRRQPRVLAVFGPSGSGKSSVIQAGLLASLLATPAERARTRAADAPERRPDARPRIDGSADWGVVISSEHKDPFAALDAAGLIGAGDGLAGAVDRWLREHPKQTRLVLVLDQSEALLIDCPEPLRRDFVTQLTALLEGPLAATVILAMRDDCSSRLEKQAPALFRDWIHPNQVLVPSELMRAELVQIVAAPASEVGLSFEDGLAADIVDDAIAAVPAEAGERVAPSTILPLLEFALTQLWKRRRDGVLVHEAYDDIGGITGGFADGLSRWADRSYRSFPEELRRFARRTVVDLVHLGDKNLGVPDSRQRRPLAALARNGDERDAVARVVRRLADDRVLVTARDGRDGHGTVEIIHDALIREWALLRQWLDDDRLYRVWYEGLERRAAAWARTAPDRPEQRDKGVLLRGGLLKEAEAWLAVHGDDIGPEERAFIARSQEQRESDLALRYQILAFAGAIGAGLGFGTAFGVVYWRVGRENWVETQIYAAAWVPLGLLFGLVVGMALRQFRHHPARRVAAAIAAGAITAGVADTFARHWAALTDDPMAPNQIAAGALTGATLGLGVAASTARWRRLAATILFGILGLAVANAVGDHDWDLITLLAAGLLLGGLTGAGFFAIDVGADTPPPVEPAAQKGTMPWQPWLRVGQASTTQGPNARGR